jgi:DNA repair exonuclease SbcCD ATPase subunit
MDLQKAIINNFLTIGAATLELDGRGLLLIQGENGDDTSAESNGAGKSSLTDAICWCNYGETARGVSGDAVVNKTAKKDCSVENVWVDGNFEYRIVRHRKHKVGKNMLTVSQRDLTTGIGTDLSKGTDKETQEVVNKILGCTIDVFKGAIYAGQEAMPDLPGMTDKQLKLLIEEAAGTGELAEAYTEANKRALVAEKEHTAALTHVRSLQARLAALNADLTDAETQHKLFEDGRKDRARVELAKVAPIKEAIDAADASLAKFDEPALTTRKGVLEAELASHKTQEAELATLARAEREQGDKVTRFRATVEQLKGAHEKSKTNLTAVDSQVGKPCGECGKPYCAHDLETVKQMRTDAVGTARKTLLETADMAKTAIAEHEVKKKAVADFKAGMTDVSAAVAELGGINRDLAAVANTRAAIARHNREIDAIKLAAKGKLTDTNPWTKAVEGKKADITRVEAEIMTADAGAAVLGEKADLYADASKVFGPAGVRAHILDTVTPFLNEKTSEYLGALADGNINATWSTLAKTAKGELKEKFNIEVINDKGAESFAGLSGGEKRKARIASAMALQDMVASRAEKPINLFIADEVDHALDDAGLERLMGVLEKKAKDRGTVIVISHNSLSDWIDNVITVKKTGGVSTVSGATERGF